MTVLDVQNLSVAFHTRNGVMKAVNNVSFSVEKGETLAIVGESGSGKSVTCYSLLGLIPTPPGKVENGSAVFYGQDLLKMPINELQDVRGNKISMIFQDPMTSLNPYMRIGDQIIESLRVHQKLDAETARQRAIDALIEVGIRGAKERIHNYPHEFSGGMRQRVMIAMALATEPELLIADEPTTALDISIQAQILALMADIQKKRELAIIFISHDLAVVHDIADRVLVMKEGNIVESGNPKEIFKQPQHAYTQKLIDAIPTEAKATKAKSEAPVLVDIKQLHTRFSSTSGPFWNKRTEHIDAVKDISLQLYQGEILGLVGESGSGKSTLGRTIMRLVDASSGQVLLENTDLTALKGKALNRQRKAFQMIFQDPYASLNPRMTVYDTLAEPMLFHNLATKETANEKIMSLMEDVGLARGAVNKYPHEFSGGQRQRIAIARALACEPKLIIADEPVSALDVTIQAQILELLLALSHDRNLTMLFISHDLSVVRYLCDRVAVMQQGQIVELNQTSTLFDAPQHPYTQSLLSAIPSIVHAS